MEKLKMSEKISKSKWNKCGIYLIEIGKHTYVGSAKCFYSRWQDHRKKARKGNAVNIKFQYCYNKYGEDNIFLSILEECSEPNLLTKEKYWIDKIKPDLNINRDPTQVPRIIINNGNGSKKVYQYTLEGDYIAEYPSTSEAARQLGINAKNISSCASKTNRVKSANGFLWSYEKVEKLEHYENNSHLAKIVKVFLLNIDTLKEIEYNSIADAVRDIGNYSNFDSACATMSSVANDKQSFYQLKYMVRYENKKYTFSKRKSAVFNINDGLVFENAKIASEKYGIDRNTIRSWCAKHKNGWIYWEERAREKFRESEKNQEFPWSTLIEDL